MTRWWLWAFALLCGCDAAAGEAPSELLPIALPSQVSSATTAPTAVATAMATTTARPPQPRVAASRWGLDLPGVVRRLPAAPEPRIALTFDACGGPGGDGYDAALITLLRAEALPATLFLSARWIEANAATAADLAAEPLFEIANHGAMHRPCSVSGRRAFGIPGSASSDAARTEIVTASERIAALTGHEPRFYRPGTGYYDGVCLSLVHELGLVPLGYSVAADVGGHASAEAVRQAVGQASDGAIVLGHMNHPESDIAEGMVGAIADLRQRGVAIVRLSTALPP